MSTNIRINPYRLFKLPEPGQGSFTKEDLKQSMRKLILVTHPDKPSGSDKKFRIVMECYKHLSNIIREREKTTRRVNNDAIEETRVLRESERVEIPASNFTRFSKGSGKDFNLNAFNNFFEENQLDNPMDRGHGDWLKEEDPEAEQRSKQRVVKGNFDSAFEEERNRLIRENRIVRHRGLQSAQDMMRGSNGVALDDQEAYSGVVKTKFGLTGVDVREAHECGIIAVDDPRYKGVNGSISMDQAKREREIASLTETDADRIEWEREEAERRKHEEHRKRRLDEESRRIREHYDRVNNLLTNV
jgi:curved DNA-binding protein CbpA